MRLPAVEIVAAMRDGVRELMRCADLERISLLMQQEGEELAGRRQVQSENRSAYRWDQEAGWYRIDGQKVLLKRSRACQVDGSEVRLGSYLRFQHDPQFRPKLREELMSGLSTRNYGRAVRWFSEAYGIEKSTVSEQLTEASRRKPRELLERRLEDFGLYAVMIDVMVFDGETFVVALGIGKDG